MEMEKKSQLSRPYKFKKNESDSGMSCFQLAISS